MNHWTDYVMVAVGAVLIVVLFLALMGCAATAPGVSAPAGGTAVSADGEICGGQLKLALADINDREGTTARCFDPVTGNVVVEISTAGRGASDAIMAMAAANQALAERLAALVERLVVP